VIFVWFATAGDLEYDMDSEDERFLYDVNSGTRKKQKKVGKQRVPCVGVRDGWESHQVVTDAQFEAAMSAMEVENYILSQRMSLEHDEEKLDDRRKKSARTIVDLRRRYRELVSDASDEGEDDDDGEDDDEMGQPSSESEERLPKPRTRRSSNEESPQPTVDARKPSSAYSTFIEPLSKLFGGLGRSLGRRGTDGHSSTPSLLRVATPEDGLSDDGAPKPTPTSSLKRDSKGRFLKLPGHRRRRHRDHSHDKHDKQEASERPVKKPVESSHRHHHHHSHSPSKPSKPRGQSHGHHSHGRRHDSRPHPTLPPPPTHHYPQRPRRPVHAPPPTSLLPLVEIEHLGTMPGLNVLSRRPFGEGSASLSGVTRPSVWLTLQRARELMPSIEPSIQDKLFEHWKARRLELGPLVPSLHSVAIADASIDEDVGIRTRDAVMEAYNDLLELRQVGLGRLRVVSVLCVFDGGFGAQDMERARLVVDTALKREKLKREYIRTNNAMIRMATEDPSLVRQLCAVACTFPVDMSVTLCCSAVGERLCVPWVQAWSKRGADGETGREGVQETVEPLGE
jgi:Enhancer of polycomb-like